MKIWVTTLAVGIGFLLAAGDVSANPLLRSPSRVLSERRAPSRATRNTQSRVFQKLKARGALPVELLKLVVGFPLDPTPRRVLSWGVKLPFKASLTSLKVAAFPLVVVKEVLMPATKLGRGRGGEYGGRVGGGGSGGS
jgi:hypothetical protein